ncbi:MAG: BrnA antitoxin family protein [Nitrospirota bacterium]
MPADFWKHAKVVYPESPKEQVTVRLDADILEWFKEQGRGYQTRMNAVLRSYVEARKDEPSVKR